MIIFAELVGLIHFLYTLDMEVVGAIIRNTNKEYLLQQRDEHAPSFKHHWTLFGGQVEEGEEPKEALLRELKEEINLDPVIIESITLIQKNINDNGITQYIFELMTNVQIGDLSLSEGETMAYVGEDALFDREFAFNIKEVFEKYIKQNK